VNSVAAGPGAEVSVDLRGVVKRYPLFARRRDRALALLGFASGLGSHLALDGVDLAASPGEAVGLIGENGSGKTTLLRIAAGISRPDGGTIRVASPVSAILELGLGFHPDFTGRDNALLYGAVIGVPDDVMRERLADVLAFAELGDFIDQPLRTYSSGMAARLAFAVATHVEPAVLVVDEALAVGDGAFQKKCVDRMVRFKDEGRTVLFCSHAMYLVAEFCERAVWLHRGSVAASGSARDVIHAYEDYLRHRGKRRLEAGEGGSAPAGQAATLRGLDIDPAGHVVTGAPVTVRVRIRRAVPGTPLHLAVGFEDEQGTMLALFATHWDRRPPLTGGDDEQVVLRLRELPFTRGRLDVTAYLGDETGLQVIDQLMRRGALTMTARRWQPGLVSIAHDWEAPSWPR
jgi:lipopolysaccharide transport system ATP-binding protein